MKNNNYYVYLYWRKETMEVFYVGKGKNRRRFAEVSNRNPYFRHICQKEETFVTVHTSYLTEEQAFDLEKELIRYYKSIGQACANFHEGGSGGDTLKYNEEAKEKMKEKCRKASLGKNNPMYGVNIWETYSEEERKRKLEKASESQKRRYQKTSEREKTSISTKKMWEKEGQKEKYRKNNSRKTYRYDKEGKLLEVYPSIYEALDFLGLKNHTTLLKHIRQGTEYKGYYWKREEEKGVTTIERVS